MQNMLLFSGICPAGWTLQIHSSSCYKQYIRWGPKNSPLTYIDAELYCQFTDEATLASTENPEAIQKLATCIWFKLYNALCSCIYTITALR